MRVRALTPKDSLPEALSRDCTVQCIDLSLLASFENWKKNTHLELRRIANDYGLKREALSLLLDAVDNAGSLYMIDGKADLLTYTWPNKEVKIFPVWHPGVLIQPTLFWLRCYPFIQLEDECSSLYSLDLAEFKPKASEKAENDGVLIASDNNHFGHFILDSMPALALLNGPLGLHRNVINTTYAYDYLVPIVDICKDCLSLNVSSRESSALGNLGRQGELDEKNIIYNARALQFVPANQFTNSYLWSMKKSEIFEKVSDGPRVEDSADRIFLSRSQAYKSRIANYPEVKEYLLLHGFVEKHAEDYSASELIGLLSKCSVIIAESGTATLNACMFSKDDTIVVSLVSSNLIKNTYLDMVYGGLPYLLTSPRRLRLIVGDPLEDHPIQTSAVCSFPIKEIEQQLKSALKMYENLSQ